MRPFSFHEMRPEHKKDIQNSKEKRNPIVLILDELKDARNLGLIFRLADATRIEHIYLYNCKFNPDGRNFKKTARSSQKYVKYSIIEAQQFDELRSKYMLVALEHCPGSIDYRKLDYAFPLALVLGSEKNGISESVLNLCAEKIHLPMLGINSSLNVATAAAVSLYHCLDRLS